MKRKLKSILLVDDDKDCNYFHKLLLEELECCENIYISQDGNEAMEFITSKTDGQYPCPDIIFLDINMPKMDGWEFLEKYKDLEEEAKARVVLIMLTTSLNPDDRERALANKDIKGFNNKFLTNESLMETISRYFHEYI